MNIRPAVKTDKNSIWDILRPIIRAGETYPLPRDWTKDQALAYWFLPANQVFVASINDKISGTYYLRPNQMGGGSHIANCGYMVAADAGGQGIATKMCTHSLVTANNAGFKGIQFNYVVASNLNAIGLWTKFGFETIGRLPKVYDHPKLGMVDALVMFLAL